MFSGLFVILCRRASITFITFSYFSVLQILTIILNYYSDLVQKFSVMLIKYCLQIIKHAIVGQICDLIVGLVVKVPKLA